MQFISHPLVGNKWCIYPSYDYTHCIVDALEDITHSVSYSCSLLASPMAFLVFVDFEWAPCSLNPLAKQRFFLLESNS